MNLKIGSTKKRSRIVRTETQPATQDGKDERFIIHTRSNDGAEYKINEVWTKDYKGEVVVKGLWVNYDDTEENILATSLLAKFFRYLQVSNADELVGKEVILQPKPNGFMAIIAYDEST